MPFLSYRLTFPHRYVRNVREAISVEIDDSYNVAMLVYLEMNRKLSMAHIISKVNIF